MKNFSTLAFFALLSFASVAFACEKPNVYENASDNRNTLTILGDDSIEEVYYRDYDMISTALGGVTLQKLDPPKKQVTAYRFLWSKAGQDGKDVVFLLSYQTDPKKFQDELQKIARKPAEELKWPNGFVSAYYATKGRLVSLDGKKIYTYRN